MLELDRNIPTYPTSAVISRLSKDLTIEMKADLSYNPTLQGYYKSLEPRIGYRLLLGGTPHFGYWDKDTSR